MNPEHTAEQWLAWIDELSENDYVIVDQILETGLYAEIRDFFDHRLPDFSQAGIGALDQNQVRGEIRGDRTYWLDRKRDGELAGFWNWIDQAIAHFNRYAYLSLSGEEFHLACYPPGARYARHLDQFQQRNNRIISVIVYLNDAWQEGDGGELQLYTAEGASVWVQPRGNTGVIFKSAVVPHEVHPARKDRHSMTGWLLHKPAVLGQLLG